MHHPAESEANALLGIAGGVPDMIIGEVKEGRAQLNDAATKHDVLTAALERFGCCRHSDIDGIVHELLRHGRAHTRHGHGVRLVAFGSLPPDAPSRGVKVVLLGTIIDFLRAYSRQHWAQLQSSESKDPGLSFLMTLEKAERGRRARAASTGSTSLKGDRS
ncbi:MAG: hypothetical protein L6Q35_07735 [Phycisphaerales bacterium]|nr:hypothetical protein [Phycisphaerales bacterium]